MVSGNGETQTYRQTDRQTDRHTDRQINRLIGRQIYTDRPGAQPDNRDEQGQRMTMTSSQPAAAGSILMLRTDRQTDRQTHKHNMQHL